MTSSTILNKQEDGEEFVRSTSNIPDEEMPKKTMKGHLGDVVEKVTTKEGWFGSYDYKFLLTPRIPCLKQDNRSPPFFGIHDKLPLLLAMVMGLQHSLAVMGGIITPPLIISGAGEGHLNLSNEIRTYMVSATLITSGVLSLIQLLRIKLPKGYRLGTGLISITGTSFTFLPIAEKAFAQMYADGLYGCGYDDKGNALPCPGAYGAFLGTVMVCCWLEVGLSLLPRNVIKKVFPPMVSGIVVTLIGLNLVGTGMSQWAGGAGPCKTWQSTMSGAASLGLSVNTTNDFFSLCPNKYSEFNPAPWGDAQWIGLGFFVFFMIIFIEVFGSPLMRNVQVVFGLLSGLVLAAATGYLDTNRIADSPIISFNWVYTFPLGFYPPLVLPLLVAFVISTVETVGDITASMEASGLEVSGDDADSRIQGGLTADGLNSFISALMTTMPSTTISQNNGVIAITRVATPSAGYWCCFWLVLFGMFSKIAGVFTAIPDAVLGGMTTFLFANVAISGIRILGNLEWTRRTRFIVVCSLALGCGVSLLPNWFSYFFTYQGDNSGLKGLINAVEIVVSTGYCLAALTAIILNTILPADPEAENRNIGGSQVHLESTMTLGAEISARMEADPSLSGYLSSANIAHAAGGSQASYSKVV